MNHCIEYNQGSNSHPNKLNQNVDKAEYSWFYSDSVKKQILTGKIMIEKLKKRKLIREEVT